MYSFVSSALIPGSPAAVWRVWSDPDRFPEWDQREERAKLDGPFAVGSTIDSKQRGNPASVSTITVVDPMRRWQASTPLPGGALVIDHLLEPQGEGRVQVSKRYTASGPFSVLFRLWFGPRLRASLPQTFASLAAEVARRG